MALTKAQKAKIVKDFGLAEKDTGSAPVQIALLTKEIDQLTEHLLKNKKDNISKRGLFMKVSQRKSLIRYYSEIDIVGSRKLLQQLNIRA